MNWLNDKILFVAQNVGYYRSPSLLLLIIIIIFFGIPQTFSEKRVKTITEMIRAI